MKPVYLITLFTVFALIFAGCSTAGRKQTAQQFDSPPATVTKEDKSLYSQALKAQSLGQFDHAIKLWKEFLSQNPNSFEGHNNLGLVYYTQDMLSQALQEFEAAYRLQPVDQRIRQNLARALQFKANMLHENREYYKTLEILARLENIVPPEEKQAVLFKQEQVEDQVFIQVIKADNVEAYQDFIKRFPDGLNAVRAQEYLGKNSSKVAKTASKKKRSVKKKRPSPKKEVTEVKSWISSGKKVADPSGSPDVSKFGSSQPVATYTPPPAKTDQKKKFDIFGVDPSPGESITEEDINASQEAAESSAAAVPFEEFDKPQRTSGDQAPAGEPVAGKDNRMATDADDGPARKEPEVMAASSSDTEQAQAVAIPTEVDAPKPPQAPADNTEMKPAEQEQAQAVADTPGPESPKEAQPEEPATALTQVEPAPQEQAQPEPMQPEPAQEMKAETPEAGPSALETAGSEEDVESESERISRIIREEIAKEEQAQAEAESAGDEPAAREAPEEEPEMDVASPSQEEPVAEQATAQEAVMPDAKPETVATLKPSPEPGEEVAASPEGTESPATATQPDPSAVQMVVIKVREGSTLNVRAEPSATGEILGYLERGDMMPFMKESGDWYQIEIEEELYGWVHKKFSEIRTVTTEASLASEPEEEMAEEIESTESPVQTEPQEFATAMVVIKVREGSTLNVRSEPSPQGEVVDMLVRGDKVPLVEEKDGWFHVQVTDDDTGWISKKFAAIEGGTTAGTPESAPVKKMVKQETPAQPDFEPPVTTVIVIKVKQGSFLNVRSAPSAQSQVMGSLSSGDMRPLMKESGEWYQIELPDGTTGWVSSKYSGKIDVISNVIPGL